MEKETEYCIQVTIRQLATQFNNLQNAKFIKTLFLSRLYERENSPCIIGSTREMFEKKHKQVVKYNKNNH